MAEGQSFSVRDFSGGTSDHYLTASPNQGALFSNLLIDEDKHPYCRDGFNILNRAPVSTGYTKFSGLYFGEEPFGSGVACRKDSMYYLDSSDHWQEILGPASNVAVPGKSLETFESALIWQKQLVYGAAGTNVLPHRIYSPTSTTYRALTLGLPALSTAPSISSAGGTGNNYVYALHYYYTFTDYNGTTFEERGPITTVSISNVGAPNSNKITLGSTTAIPTLANTSYTNYAVTAIKVKIFRTINNGTVFYYVGEVTNGTGTYEDTSADTTIDDNEVIYTDGGVLEYTQPPVGTRYVTQVNDYFWFATDTTLQHSIQGAPGAAPAEYQYYTDQKIKGLGSIISFPILFCDRSVYRVEGVFDEIGDGGFELREISKTAGCVSHRSIVAIPGGLVWAGNGGFYFTDGNSVSRITLHLEDHYQTWKNANIYGVYDSVKNVVLWTVSSSPGSTTSPNDMCVVLHLNFGLNATATFTSIESKNNLYPTALAFSESDDVDSRFRNRWLMMDSRGYFLYSDPLTYTDPRIANDVPFDEFARKAIIFRYESAGLDFGDDSVRKYCTHITAEFRTETDIAVQFFSRRDDGGPWGALTEMRQDGNILWNISEYGWDDTNDDIDHDWDSSPVTEGKRHLPAGTLRSTRRQIAMTNALTWISKSDDADKGLATTAIGADGITRTVTLETSGNFWPGDCEDYEIAFDDDNYATFYRIKDRLSDTQITLYDPYAGITALSGRKWQMRGYRKNERVYPMSFTIFFAEDAATQAPSRGSSQYQNA